MKIFLFFLIALAVIARFVFLDQDALAWCIGVICPEDEFFYAVGAFNYFKHGDFHYAFNTGKNLNIGFTELVATPITLLGFKIFGYNYFGLRAPVVLVSLISIAISYLIIRRTSGLKWSLFLTLFLLTEFSLMILSRYQTPTAHTGLFIVLIAFLFLKAEDEIPKWKQWTLLALAGVIASLSAGATVYNFYIPAATGFAILVYSIIKRNPAFIGSFLVGMVIGFLLYIEYLHLHDLTLTELKSGISSFNASRTYNAESSLTELIMRRIRGTRETITNILTTNIFRYNLSFAFLFILTIPFAIKIWINKKSLLLTLLLSLILFCFIQNTLENSYPYRKLTPILFVFILLIGSIDMGAFSEWLRSQFLQKKRYIGIGILVTALFSFFILYHTTSPGFFHFFIETGIKGENTSAAFNSLNAFLLILTIIGVCHYLYTGRHLSFLIKAICVILIIPGIFLYTQYFFLQRTYHYRNAMIDMSKHINDKVVIGEMPWAYQLYNSSVPTSGGYPSFIGKNKDTENPETLLQKGIAEYSVKYFYPKDPALASIKKGDITDSNLVVIEKYFTSPSYTVLYKSVPKGK